MARAKPALKRPHESLSNYKFDTSNYVVLDTGVRRDAATGKLVMSKTNNGKEKSSE
jgi:hypothetical protein